MSKLNFICHLMRLLICILVLAVSVPVRAMSALDEAQLQTYFFDQAIAIQANLCQKRLPRLAEQLRAVSERFRASVGSDLAEGRAVGTRLLAGTGQLIEQVASDLAFKARESHAQENKSRTTDELCFDFLREVAPSAAWTVDHFLKLGYDGQIRDVGYTQGYPCDWLHQRADRAVTSFTRGAVDYAGEDSVARDLLWFEAMTVLRFIGNCEAAQARAPEFRVANTQDYSIPKNALVRIENLLNPSTVDRHAQLLGVVESLRGYPLNHRK